MLEEDRELLRELAAKCRDGKEKIRYLSLHAIASGHEVPLVSEIFCVDESTIYRWIERWQHERNVQDKTKSGRPSAISDKDKERIKNLIEEGEPKKYGINASFWDTKELHLYFQKRGMEISRETLRTCLKGMGARYVKAQIKYAEADIEKQKEFARKFFEEMESTSGIVIFQDEMSAECSARKGYGWTFEKRLEIKAPQRYRKRVNCFGAVNIMEGKVIEMTSKEAKAPAFVRFLNKIAVKYSGERIVMYLDNLPVHKSAKVKKFLERHPGMRLEFLPPYSPELNPQEQWWNYKRRKFLNNRNFKSTHHMATSMNRFAKLVPPEQVMSICSLEPLEKLLRE